MNIPNTSQQPATVPIVPDTHAKTAARFWSSVVVNVGFLMMMLQNYGTNLTAVFPHAKWLGPGIALAGGIWKSIQTFLDHTSTVSVHNENVFGG